MDYDSESKLLSLLIRLISPRNGGLKYAYPSIIPKVTSLLRSIDWDSQPKPESEFMSLITQTISLFFTMDLDSQPKPLLELISLFSRQSSLPLWPQVDSLIRETFDLEPEPELMSLIRQILSLVLSIHSVREKFVILCPQAEVALVQGKFHVVQKALSYNKWKCFASDWTRIWLPREEEEEDVIYIYCSNCNGENHKGCYNNVPVEINHTLHRKHSLQLVLRNNMTRKCYCCDEDLHTMLYYCSACDLAVNITCAKKQPVLSIDYPKWHEHTLTLFPRRSLLTCDACALTHSSCPFYTCPPCDFVIHQSCISLPRVIRISRHHHRIAFTYSFGVGDWSCGVCRTKIDNYYGGYRCIKKDCFYGAHSKCI